MHKVNLLALSFSVGVLLAACGGGTPPIDPAREPSGTAQNWDGGAATVQAVVTGDEGEVVGTMGASSALAADGSFALTLPATPDSSVLTDSSIAVACEGGEFDGTVTPEVWREAFADLAVEQGGETVGFLYLASSPEIAGFRGGAVGDFIVAPVYVTEDVTIEGTCTSEFGTFDLDAQLEAGWTLLSFTIKELDPDSGFPSRARFESVVTVPDGAEWYFVENEPEPALGTQSPVAEGLNGPMGVEVAEDGTVWAIDSGLGGEEVLGTLPDPEGGEPTTVSLGDTARIVKVAPDGTQSDAATLPSIGFAEGEASGGSQLALLDGTLYATSGDWESFLGPDPRPLLAEVVKLEGDAVVSVASTWDIEASENPDGVEGPHAHPYGLAAGPDGMLWVADAGGNDLLKVDPATGEVSVVAVFGPKEITDPESGETFPAEAVPTGVTFGEDGNLYVTFFHGGVSRVTPGGEVSSYNEDVILATDVEAAPDGNLYVVQIADFSFGPGTGSVVRVNQDGKSEVVLDGLAFPTAIAFNGEGDAYLTLNSLGAPGSGEVVKVEALTELTSVDQTPVTSALGVRSSGWIR